ncbi:DUF6204 family protein [Streptomyces sp. P9-A4]|uniref:DUF6204 family protein n=1 Tax=Streptomyces sp. P9-A4 TaxID=3072285 RepID=UPI002FC9C103
MRPLIAGAGEHDLFKARFTEEGTITYEPSLRTFAFRVLIPAGEEDTEDLVMGQAEELAAAAIRKLGGEYRDLRSVTTDLSKIKVKRKGR